MRMSSLDTFRKIYGLAVHRNGSRVPVMETYLGLDAPGHVSADDLRNEPALYRELAQDAHSILEDCLQWLLRELRDLRYEEAEGVLDGIAFLQAVSGDVLWRYNAPLSVALEGFVREFDRLDVDSERRRLYAVVRADDARG
jgi:hypothetical protein